LRECRSEGDRQSTWHLVDHLDLPVSLDLPAGAVVMSTPNNGSRAAAWKLWRRNGLIWAGLMLLLLPTLPFTYVPMGRLEA
jgi:hypothetical protein